LAIPIWNKFEKWAMENEGKVAPKSKIGDTFHYYINEFPYLKSHIKDGRLKLVE
jgi:hypothetical protein